MNLGYFNYPMPVNEPVLNYAPGSAEKKRLKEVLAELKKEKIDENIYSNTFLFVVFNTHAAEGMLKLDVSRNGAHLPLYVMSNPNALATLIL